MAYKHGRLKGASASLKKAAKTISLSDAEDFAGRVETEREQENRLKAASAHRRARGG